MDPLRILAVSEKITFISPAVLNAHSDKCETR